MPSVRCVFGIRGHGKSTLVRELIRSEPRLLIHDPHTEHECLQLSQDDAVDYLDGLESRGQLEKFRVGVWDADPETFCRLAWALAETRCGYTFVLEEADLIAPPGREPYDLRRLVAQGRHYGVSLLSTSRRPAEVSRLVTSQAAEYFCFTTREPGDLVYLKSILGPDAGQLSELTPFSYLHWTPTGAQVRALVAPSRKKA